jgi:hypothetical protein
MAKFDFMLTRKLTVLEHIDFSINADTLEEAKAKAIEAYQDDNMEDADGEPSAPFIMQDTSNPLDLEKNDGNPTEILYLDTYVNKEYVPVKIFDNIPKA